MLNASLRRLVRKGKKKQPSMWISSHPQEVFSHLLLCTPGLSILTMTQKPTCIGITEVSVCPNLFPGYHL